MFPLARGFQKGTAFSFVWGIQRGWCSPLTGRIQRNRRFRGTRFSVGKASVLYLCGADGSRNCSTPRKVWLQLRRSGGKGCPLRGSISDRKRLAGGAGKHCLSAVSFAEQRYIKAPVSRCLPPYQNHHGSFARRLSIASPSTFFVRLSLRWKWSAAPISGCSMPSVNP